MLDRTGDGRTAYAGLSDPLPEVTLKLLALQHEGLLLRWHALTVRYHADLYEAADVSEFDDFLGRYRDAYCEIADSSGWLTPSRSHYFPNGSITGESRWLLCRDLDAAWRSYHFLWHCVWTALDELTPWYDSADSPGC